MGKSRPLTSLPVFHLNCDQLQRCHLCQKHVMINGGQTEFTFQNIFHLSYLLRTYQNNYEAAAQDSCIIHSPFCQPNTSNQPKHNLSWVSHKNDFADTQQHHYNKLNARLDQILILYPAAERVNLSTSIVLCHVMAKISSKIVHYRTV